MTQKEPTRKAGKKRKAAESGSRKKATRHSHMNRAAHVGPVSGKEPMYVVRRSPIHGRGVYATRRIPKGTRIAEYLGERISHEEADARYAAKADDGHTFLFVVTKKICIDATEEGNDARFINHSCDPNLSAPAEANPRRALACVPTSGDRFAVSADNSPDFASAKVPVRPETE